MHDLRRKTDEDPAALASVSAKLAELGALPARELARRYHTLFGVPTRSNNRQFLIRKLAWKIQEDAFGGLTQAAKTRISELGDEVPATWRQRRDEKRGTVAIAVLTRTAMSAPSARSEPDRPRDPRLPPAGAVLARLYKGERHEVRVLELGFEYAGRPYASLSQVARAITGTPWNGFAFFSIGGSEKGDPR